MNRAICATLTAICLGGLVNLPVLAELESSTSGPEVQELSQGGDAIKIADSSSDSKSDAKSNEKLAEAAKDPKADAKDPKKEPAAKAKSGGSVNIATRLASFATGVVVGTPIAVVRRTGIEIVQGEHDLIGEADRWYKKVALVMPGFLAVPYGAISGGIGGSVYAVKNAWVGSGDEPFGKESFSLGDIGN